MRLRRWSPSRGSDSAPGPRCGPGRARYRARRARRRGRLDGGAARVTDHDRLWARLAQALRPGGVLEVQCGGQGNIDRVREVIDAVARDRAPELVGWSPWVFAAPQETEKRLQTARVHRDPVLVGGAPYLSRGRGRVRVHVDSRRALGTPPRGAARTLRGGCRGEGQRSARLCPAQRLSRQRR